MDLIVAPRNQTYCVLLHCTIFLVVGVLCRLLISRICALGTSCGSLRVHLMNTAASFIIIGCFSVHDRVYTIYGSVGFFIIAFIQEITIRVFFDDALFNPCDIVVDCVVESTSYDLSFGTYSLIAMVIGAVLSQFNMCLQSSMCEALGAEEENVVCSTSLNGSLVQGLAIECLATVFHIFSILSALMQSKTANGVLESLLTALITTLGRGYTGMFANPLNASAQTLWCEGTVISEHLIVYWIGPLLITYVTALLIPTLQSQRRMRVNLSHKNSGHHRAL